MNYLLSYLLTSKSRKVEMNWKMNLIESNRSIEKTIRLKNVNSPR